jgi:hypothetical protein
MLWSNRRVAIVVAGSILFYYAVFIWLLSSTSLCEFCAASQLWKYAVVASSPTWLIFLCFFPYSNTLALKRATPFRSYAAILLALVAFVVVSIFLAPYFTFYAFAQAYEIVYLNQMPFPFSAGMIVLLSATLGLQSFNLGLAWRPKDLVADSSYSVAACWRSAGVNFSLIGWLVLLIQYFALSNQFMAFSILLMSTTIIPVFSQFYPSFQKLPSRFMQVLHLLGLGSLATIFGFLGFLTGFPLSHPFLVVALFSSVAVCLSSPLGRALSRYTEVTSWSQIGRWRYALAVLLVVLGVFLTWFYSHAAISVWISETIHIG